MWGAIAILKTAFMAFPTAYTVPATLLWPVVSSHCLREFSLYGILEWPASGLSGRNGVQLISCMSVVLFVTHRLLLAEVGRHVVPAEHWAMVLCPGSCADSPLFCDVSPGGKTGHGGRATLARPADRSPSEHQAPARCRRAAGEAWFAMGERLTEQAWLIRVRCTF